MTFQNRTFSALVALMLLGVTASALGANTAPTASSMGTGVYENDVLEFYAPGVLTNATDPEDDPLTAVLLVDVAHGALTLNPDGSFIYTPETGYSGPDSFDFAAFDGSLPSAPATVSISVIALPVSNVPPVAAPQSYSAICGVAFNVAAPGVLAGVTDPDSSVFTALCAVVPSSGSLLLIDDGSFTYVSNAGFTGTDSFQIQASDGIDFSAPVTITIVVAPQNRAPIGADAAFNLNEDETLVLPGTGLAALCSDPDGDLIKFELVTAPSQGTLNLGDYGSVTYQPQADWSGKVSFEYQISDGELTAGPYTVTLEIMSVNDVPQAADDEYTLTEDGSLLVKAGGVLNNDLDVESDVLSAKVVNWPKSGELVFNEDGSFEYVPQPDFNGSDSFSYCASDGTDMSPEAVVKLNVQAMNDAPGFDNAGDISVSEDGGEIKQQWAKNIVAGPADESGQSMYFKIDVSQSSALFAWGPMIDESGMLTFGLLPDAWGTADVTVVLYDDGGVADKGERDSSEPVTFRIFVLAANDAPSFIPGGNVSVLEDCGAQEIAWASQISAGAGDAAQILMFNVTEISDADMFAVGPSIDANGMLRFTPAANANGRARITVVLAEARPYVSALTSMAQSFVIFVRPVNDAPSFSIGADVKVRGNPDMVATNWASEIVAGPQDEQSQKLLFETLSMDNPGLFESEPRVDSMGTLYFKPAKGARGIAVITLRLVDEGGTELGGTNISETQTFTIEVEGEKQEVQGSCTAGSGNMPWWMLLAAPAMLVGAVRRKRVKA
jgi:hypothetical protein